MPEVQTCVVCGEGSNRETWKNSQTLTKADKGTVTFVACDSHSAGEIAAAVKKALATV